MNADTYDNEPDDATDAGEDAENDPQDSGEQTTLVPNSMLTDPKPGDKVTMEIVHCYDDECEVRVAKEEKPKESRTADEAFVSKFGE